MRTENWLPLRGRWLRYFLIGFTVLVGLPLFIGGYNYFLWSKHTVRTVAEVGWASNVSFPSGSRLIRGEANGVWWVRATLTIPRNSIETFVSQSRFQRVSREDGVIKADGSSGGFDRIWVEIPVGSSDEAVVDFFWSQED